MRVTIRQRLLKATARSVTVVTLRAVASARDRPFGRL